MSSALRTLRLPSASVMRIATRAFGVEAVAATSNASSHLAAAAQQATAQPATASNAHVKSSVNKVPFQKAIQWDIPMTRLEDWLIAQPLYRIKTMFQQLGFVSVRSLISKDELEVYSELYHMFLKGQINASSHRHDLGSHDAQKIAGKENVCQIMWPSDYVENLAKGPLHERALALSQVLLGNDMSFDFDMLITKGAQTDTCTPWHQDQAYWLDMPDKRAVSCWTAIDDATVSNGCMWFGPGSHRKPVRQHAPAAPGHHVLQTDFEEDNGVAAPLLAGSCTFHHGGTLHYTRGNTTHTDRRAYIVNFRPQSMVDFSRQRNFDHGREGWEKFDHSNAGDVYKTSEAPISAVKRDK